MVLNLAAEVLAEVTTEITSRTKLNLNYGSGNL